MTGAPFGLIRRVDPVGAGEGRRSPLCQGRATVQDDRWAEVPLEEYEEAASAPGAANIAGILMALMVALLLLHALA
jgi:hypothetical protein